MPTTGYTMSNATQIIDYCRKHNITFAFAESCTGGRLASAIVDVPGASDVFHGSLVTYSDDMKMNALDVDGYTLGKLGAVSENIAAQMAVGAYDLLEAKPDDAVFTVSTTGFVGPFTEGEERHAYIAVLESLGKRLNCEVHEITFKTDDRKNNQEAVVDRAIYEIANLLEKHLIESTKESTEG